MLQAIQTTPLSTIVLVTGLLLILIGFAGALIQKNLIRMVVGFALVDTGIHMVMVSIGHIIGGTAPIMNEAAGTTPVVDPVPSALVLTSIVIGLGVTAVMLSYVVQIHQRKNTLSIDDCAEMKW